MNETVYKLWRKSKETYLIALGYTEEAIEYILTWFDEVDGCKEDILLEMFVDKDIKDVRIKVFNVMSRADSSNWFNWDFMFALYTPMLVIRFTYINLNKE